MADRWEVWDEHRCRTFRSFATAERYARRYVQASTTSRFAVEVEITRRLVTVPEGIGRAGTVAHVRADALGRIWTDVVATHLV